MLKGLPSPTDPRAVLAHGDDAGVYLLTPELALVQTVDFFTPIVDDPDGFGRIAAANSLSDVWAMGATPLTALNVVGFPKAGPPGLDVLHAILAGGYAKAAEAGVSILGGHTVDDREPKYGLAVTGVAHPDRLFRQDAARAGQVLVLTKPLGVGLLATALKNGRAIEGTERRLIDVCGHLNRGAAEAARAHDVRAVTDVTGFGLVLHAFNLARASGVTFEFEAHALPVLPGAREALAAGLVPGGTRSNRLHARARCLSVAPDVDEADELLACDAQTSGGLLLAVDAGRASALVAALQALGTPAAAVVGRVLEGPAGIRLVA